LIRFKISKQKKRKTRYILLILIIGLLGVLPRFLVLKIGWYLGSYYSRFDSETKRKIGKNIENILDIDPASRQGDTLIKSVLSMLGVNVVEVFRMVRKKKESLKKIIIVKGEGHLEQALNTGNGVILLTCHLGAWELLGAYLAEQGYKPHALVKTLKDKNLNQLLDDFRNRNGLQTHARGGSFASLKQILNEGGLLAILMDQDTKVKGIFTDFLGKSAYTPVGPALLAILTRAEVIPAFIYFDKQVRKHIITFEPPVDIVRTGDQDDDIRVITEQFNEVLRRWIMAHMEQWVWFHERWKTAPNSH